MHIEKKNLLCAKSDVKLACDLLRGRFLASQLCVRSLNNGRKKDSKFDEAFQGVKATCDTALKTGDMGIFKKREVTCLRC